MTEQQACTLCGAGGHLAAQCNWNQATSSKSAVVHPEQAEGAQGDADDLASPMRERLLSMGVDEETAESIAAELAICLIPKLMQREAALAQPSPAPELERPEVVAFLNEWRDRDQGGIRVTPALSAMSEEGLQKEYGPQASVVRREPLMTIVQHKRIDAARLACVGILADEILKLSAGHDAAQAKVAELEKQEPVAEVVESGGTLTAVIVRHSYATKLPVGTKLYAAPVAKAGQVPEGVQDLCRFLAKLYCELDGLRYSTAKLPPEEIADALICKWPVLQGTRNQLNITRISDQPYDESKLHAAIAAMLAAAPAQGGE